MVDILRFATLIFPVDPVPFGPDFQEKSTYKNRFRRPGLNPDLLGAGGAFRP
jgi:hypothetical protein